ncbi:MAG: hypothetical protein E6J43_08815 [Chloroflexi bacterium]|nr:MAG: hypothetical protein E6J43_08815 [Chloroflexota bacterium]
MSKFRNPATPQRRPRFRLAACRRCGGDALLDLTDGPEWRCLQCGRMVADEPGSYAGAVMPPALYFKEMAGRPAA